MEGVAVQAKPGRESYAPSDFLLRFGASTVVAVIALVALSPVREGLRVLTVWSISSSAHLLGLAAWPGDEGLLVFSGPTGSAFAYRVIEECTAVSVVALFAVAVFALPGVDWRRRLIGVSAGSAVLLVANWLRLLNLAWLGVHHPAYFDAAHVWVWQVLGMALVVALWMIWMRWATGQRGTVGMGRQRMMWFGGVGAVGGLVHLTSAGERYSEAVEAAIGGVQAALQILPYTTLLLTAPARDWQLQVRSVSLVIAVALTAALTGPAARERLLAGAKAIPLVYLAHVVATMLERSADARLGVQDWAIPMLVLLYALPLLVPVLLGYRSFIGARPVTETAVM